jgi:hypothetical protein
MPPRVRQTALRASWGAVFSPAGHDCSPDWSRGARPPPGGIHRYSKQKSHYSIMIEGRRSSSSGPASLRSGIVAGALITITEQGDHHGAI